MGFLSKLFNPSLSRDHWYIKVDLLSELSEIARRHWNRDWIAMLTGSRHGYAESGERAEARPEPSGETVLRVFQAHLTTHFIREHEYIPAEDQGDFAGRLLGAMVGERTPEAVALLERYGEVEGDWDTLFSRFTADMAGSLDIAEFEAARIGATLPQFTTEQHYITALCFGDTPRVRALKAEIEAADKPSQA